MADANTPKYAFVLPEVGASDDTWGTKLNNNFTKLDTILAAAFPAGSASDPGTNIRVTGTTPAVQFLETDAVSPAGQFTLQGYGTGSFALTRATTASFGTPVNIWRYIGSTDQFLFDVPVSAPMELVGSTAMLRFNESDQTDPAGKYTIGASSNSFSLYKYSDPNWVNPTILWTYSGASNDFTFNRSIIITGAYGLDAGTGAVKGSLTHTIDAGYIMIGSYQISTYGNGSMRGYWDHNNKQLVMTSYDTAQGPAGIRATNWEIENAGNLFLRNTSPSLYLIDTDAVAPAGGNRVYCSSGRLWVYETNTSETPTIALAAIGSDYVRFYADTYIGYDSGQAFVGNATSSAVVWRRPSAGINYMKVNDGSTLRVQSLGGGNWASISSTSGWAAGTSDIRLKENVAPISYGLDTILALRPIEFDWIKEKRHDIGFSAQDVEEIIPEIVEIWKADPANEGEIDTYAMRKDALVAVLVKAVQELAARVQTLEGAK